MRKLLWVLLLLLGLAAGGGYLWLDRPLAVADSPADLSIEPGIGAAQVAQRVRGAGVQVWPELLYLWFRVSGDSRDIKAGS